MRTRFVIYAALTTIASIVLTVAWFMVCGWHFVWISAVTGVTLAIYAVTYDQRVIFNVHYRVAGYAVLLFTAGVLVSPVATISVLVLCTMLVQYAHEWFVQSQLRSI